MLEQEILTGKFGDYFIGDRALAGCIAEAISIVGVPKSSGIVPAETDRRLKITPAWVGDTVAQR